MINEQLIEKFAAQTWREGVCYYGPSTDSLVYFVNLIVKHYSEIELDKLGTGADDQAISSGR